MKAKERDARRRAELRQALLELMDEVDENARLRWLSVQLAEYADRWLGFFQAKPDLGGLTRGTLFWSLEEAVGVLREELDSSGSDAGRVDVIRGFSECLNRIRAGDLEAPERLRTRAEELVKLFSTDSAIGPPS